MSAISIGNDYYSNIMSTERMKIQEGLYIIKPKFHWMINEQTKVKEKGNRENIMLIMIHSKQYTS